MTIRALILIAVIAVLFVAGLAFSRVLGDVANQQLYPGEMLKLNRMVALIAVIYLFSSALPFVPGAEIGLAMMMTFGARAAVLVYGCMVLALLLSFAVGCMVPSAALARGFRFVGLTRAADLVRKTMGMSPSERQQYLSAKAPNRLVPALLRHRYLALALAFNIPGNSLIGGGGGIAMFAGMSGLFSHAGYLLTVVLAVAPVPVLIVLIGYNP